MVNNSLKDVSIKDLQSELHRREVEAALVKQEMRAQRLVLFLAARPDLLLLLKHDRTSCATSDNSGFHPHHGGAECARCALAALTEEDTDVDIVLSLTLTKIKE